MSKFQKIIFGSFVAFSIILAFWAYSALKNNKQPSVKAITLIPDSCNVLMKFDNYTEFSNTLRNKNLLWQDLKDISCFGELEKHFYYFDSILVANEFFGELVSHNPVYVCTYPNNKFLITCNVKELADQQICKEAFEKLATSFTSFSLTAEVNNGVIGITNSGDILKKLFVSKTANLISNKNFSLLTNSAKYSGSSMFVNKGSNSFLLGNSYSNITFKPDKIILNGLKLIDSTEFLGDLNSQPQSNLDFLTKIPLLCNAFEVFTIKDAESIFSTHTKNDWWQNVNNKAMFNAKKQFYQTISDYIIKIEMPSKNQALVLNINDSLKMSEIAPFMKDSNVLGNPGILKLLTNPGSFVSSTFSALKLNELNYFVLFKNRVVFTSTESDAEIFINAQENNSSILANKKFRQFASKNFDSEFHYLNYKLINSLNKTEVPFTNLLTADDLKNLKNMSHCSYMATYKNNFLNYRFNLSYSQENFSDEPGVLWTMSADTTITSKPFLFKNHITKGNEIIFQTSSNSIYLQNATGKTIWKRKINEQIKSEVFMVDAFKNGKFQLLFNTDNYLHLIDRNGNYVQGYPVKLPSRATNKLSLFDYENKNELRLFIACADNKIHNYSIWGVRQEGFKTFPTATEVNLPIKYCKVGMSDYLITADKKGKLYAFSRKGDGRIDFKNKLIEEADNFEVEAGNLLSNTQIIYYDSKGHLLEKISLEDKKEIYKTSVSVSKPVFCFNDFDKNKIIDAILAYPDKLEVYDLSGTKIFGRGFQDNINPTAIKFTSISNSNYLNIFDDSNSIINDVEQNTFKEFKSTQTTVICDLFNDGKAYVLVVLNGELKCLKL